MDYVSEIVPVAAGNMHGPAGCQLAQKSFGVLARDNDDLD